MSTFADITSLIETQEELKKLNNSLEQRVAQRTAELESLNAELEAFAYSLSHDMKAPLTRMESWFNVLGEKSKVISDDSLEKPMAFVRAEIKNINAMITAMLALSRASKVTFNLDSINLSALATEVIDELRLETPGRTIEARIEPDLKVNADLNLVRILLRNLLENAVKFSGNRPVTKIEIGKTRNAHEEFFVRDNGVGFDGKFADKLFAPFQRLHSQADFPGTGIGLAIAQRVVHRHGGRIHAESIPDAGTTFFFSLPDVSKGVGQA